MRIAVLTPNAGDLFGQERVLRDSAKLLRAAGHQIFVVTETLTGTPDYCDDLLHVPLAASLGQIAPPWRARQINAKVMSFLEKVKPNVVHFIDQFNHQLALQIRSRYPVLLSVHSVAPTCPASSRLILGNQVCTERGGWGCVRVIGKFGCLDSFRGLLRRWLVIDRFVRQRKEYLQADHVVAVSHYIRKILIENGFAEDRMSVVYNPIEVPKATPLSQAPPNLICCVSRLHPLKGIDVILRALARLKDKNWELWLCGEGSEREKLESLAKNLGIDTRIKFLGKVPYEKTQQIVVSSRCLIQANVAPEAFGLAAAEAAAQGVPVIAANMPALNEILAEGNTAIFFPPGDDQALANAITAVLTREACSDRAHREDARAVAEKYSPPRHLDGMLTAYERCISHFQAQNRVS